MDTILIIASIVASIAIIGMGIGTVTTIGDEPTPEPTAGTAYFSDTFDDGSINTTIWVNTGCAESAGILTCSDDGQNFIYASPGGMDNPPFSFSQTSPYMLTFRAKYGAGRACASFLDETPLIADNSGDAASCRQSVGTQHGLYFGSASSAESRIPASVDYLSFTTNEWATYTFAYDGTRHVILKDGETIMSGITGLTPDNVFIVFGTTENDQDPGSISVDNLTLSTLNGTYEEPSSSTPSLLIMLVAITLVIAGIAIAGTLLRD